MSCSKNEQLVVSELTGTYQNAEGAEDYSYLKLWEDSTFFLVQSPNFGDAMVTQYGKWIFKNGIVELLSSVDLENFITLFETEDIIRDTLLIHFHESLYTQLGSFNVKLSVDSVVWHNPAKLIIDKSKYFQAVKHKIENIEKTGYYQYYPAELIIWNQNYHFTKWYIFSKSNIIISLEKQIPRLSETSKVIEYRVLGNKLVSLNESDLVLRNTLVKME